MNTAGEITGWTILKNALYVPAAFVGLSMESYGILAAFLLFDLITGIWRTVATDGPEHIKSWRGINGFFSKFLFLSVPIVIAWMGHGLGLQLIQLAQMALGILILFTGYSILGNIYTIRTGEKVKEFDAMKVILKSIEGILNKYTVPPDHK